ncbi:octopamine receptor Oamb isoform X4 [Nasonia vitripennis]|uniref:G-protein coupled receptors family 1 profile domain-containing protein n=1 Tax=Nasonia vitripennis TaxID=7425 RepID=A0A7M7QEF6_NASVI|nr:octopamine receptor Oamb isoform X4 [Nasonia vitripennis]
MRELNESACNALYTAVEWSGPGIIVTLAVLAVVNVMVVLGNVLVILAVYNSIKLRNVTNMFIVSLAMADLMVGIAVLPFSATWEVFKDDELEGNITFPENGPFNTTSSSSSSGIIVPVKPCRWICELTNDAGYVVYSALGSFYIPTLVMLFFYWRIYNAAVSTTRAINRGFRTTKSSKMMGSRFDEQRLTLRIHRGRASEYNGSNGSPRSSDCTAARSPSRRDRIKISVSYPSTETLNTKCNNTLERTPSRCSQVSVHYSNGQTQSQLCPSSRTTHLKVGGIGRVGSSRRPSRRSSCESQVTGDVVSLRELTPGTNEEKPRVMKMGKRNIKAQVKRIRMETKAAKTLGIIVGGFILCWLPFFTMYLVRAFCPNCIHPTVFSVLFWLGYCNSAINPCIYALFSKDFRFAFKKIICNCFCKQRANTLRRGSDGSQLTTRFRFSGTSGAPAARDAARRRAFRSRTPTPITDLTPTSNRRATPDDCSTSGSARSASP